MKKFLLVASALLALLPFAFPSIDGWMQYDRSAIAAGEAWRLLTGHWTHWSLEHLFWSGGAFLLLAGLFRGSARRLLGCVALSALAVSAAVWVAFVQPPPGFVYTYTVPCAPLLPTVWRGAPAAMVSGLTATVQPRASYAAPSEAVSSAV